MTARVRLSSCVPRAWGRLVAVAVQEQRLAIDGARMRAGASLAQAKASWGDPGVASLVAMAPLSAAWASALNLYPAGPDWEGVLPRDVRRVLYWDRWA